jgi:hypothetical protein
MEAWRYGRERQSDRKQFRSNGGKSGRERRVCGGRRAAGAHEALPHTSPGGKPPETPGPLSLGLASEHNIPVMRERGPTDRAHIKPPVGRQRSLSRPAAARALRAHEALPHAPPGGQAPLRPPIRGGVLDRDRPSHGSRDRNWSGYRRKSRKRLRTRGNRFIDSRHGMMAGWPLSPPWPRRPARSAPTLGSSAAV